MPDALSASHSPFRHWRIALFACPPGSAAIKQVTLGEHSLPAVELAPASLCQPFPVSFDDIYPRLEALPRMFIEPDGSLVWVGCDAAMGNWQLDGQLTDRAGRLLSVELKGGCPRREFDELLELLGWPTQAVVVCLLEQGICLVESDFRRAAFGSA